MPIFRGGVILQQIPERITVIGIGKGACDSLKAIAPSDTDNIEFLLVDGRYDDLLQSRSDLLTSLHLLIVVSCLEENAALPVVCALGNLSREVGVLAVAVVTRGADKIKDAFNSIILADYKDLAMTVNGVTDLLTKDNLIAMDFIDMKTVLSEIGVARSAIGMAYGEDKYLTAARNALSSPLLRDGLRDASRAIIKVNASDGEALPQIVDAMCVMFGNSNPLVNALFAAIIDKDLKDEVRATIIANY